MTQISSDLHDLTVAQLATLLRERKVSALETAEHFLARVAAHTEFGAFLDLQTDVTLAQARAADARLAAGNAGDPRLRPAVEALTSHPDPVVSEQARWSLARLPRAPRL